MKWILQSLKRQQSIDLEKKLSVTRAEFNGLHSGLRLTFLVGRVFGIMPLTGLMSLKGHDIKFQLKSPYAIVYFISSTGQTLMCVMNFYWLLGNKISLTNIFFTLQNTPITNMKYFLKRGFLEAAFVLDYLNVFGYKNRASAEWRAFLSRQMWTVINFLWMFTNFLFYTSSAVSFAILANISRNWRQLIMKVKALESKLPPLSDKVTLYCNVTMILILAAALVEHTFSVYFGVTVARACDPNNTAETFFHYDKPWIFTYTSYSTWKGILIEVFNIQATFIWSYSDLLIMLISIYLTEHFKTHYRLLSDALKRENFPCDEFRAQHLNIVKLVKMINETIGIYILICFGSNMYWTCTQLFYCMNKNYTGHFESCDLKDDTYNPVHGIEHTIYFAYSFSFLVVRTLLVLLLAARVHTASLMPIALLYGIPNSKFTAEVERFIGQINNIKVALSGLDFFYVTRTMILTLFGTIVTYELVLLQFNK